MLEAKFSGIIWYKGIVSSKLLSALTVIFYLVFRTGKLENPL